MLLHLIGWLYGFMLTAFFTASVTLSPLFVAWSSFWTYAAFVAFLIPGYILAWLTLVIISLIIGLIGVGAFLGSVAAIDGLKAKKKIRGRI